MIFAKTIPDIKPKIFTLVKFINGLASSTRYVGTENKLLPAFSRMFNRFEDLGLQNKFRLLEDVI